MPLPAATDKEKTCMAALKEKFPPSVLDPEDSTFLEGNTYLRFARARNGNIEKAAEMLGAALKWRKEFKPYAIGLDDIKEVLTTLTMTVGGRDKFGSPILVMTLGMPNKCPVADRLNLMVYILEETQKRGYDTITWIVDFSEMGKHEKDPESKETRKATMQVLQDYYPERLGLMLLYRTPWYVRLLVTFVKPFLDKSTRKKIFKAGQEVKDLEPFIDISQIPKAQGGQMDETTARVLTKMPEYDEKDDAAKREAMRQVMPEQAFNSPTTESLTN